VTIHFILAIGLAAGITGWNNPNPETKAMCRCFGVLSAAVALQVWGPAIVGWGLG
jgi:hypothetical protein